MPTDAILTWRDYRDERPRTRTSIGNHREASYPDYLARLWEAYHDGLFEPAGLPVKPDTLTPLLAYVNHGRWLVKCDCGRGSVLPAEPGEDVLCPLCEGWHSVEFPMLKSIIDRQLLLLPGHRLNGPELRNWRP